jgi:hypothetical protein
VSNSLAPWLRNDFELTQAWIGSENMRPLVRALLGPDLVCDCDPTIGSRSVVFVGRNAFGRVQSMTWNMDQPPSVTP